VPFIIEIITKASPKFLSQRREIREFQLMAGMKATKEGHSQSETKSTETGEG